MRYSYEEFSGDLGRFFSPDELFPHPQLVEFLIEHGQDALDALPEMDEQVQALIQDLIDAGLLERDEDGALRITPRMARGMQQRALLEIFQQMRAGVKEGHETREPGRAGERLDGTRPYQFGDPVSELALSETLRNSIRRSAGEAHARGEAPRAFPIRLQRDDLEVHHVESTTDCATCVLIDLSGSMARYGRHVAAKKVAMGLRSLIGGRFPNDTVDFIGFASVAEPLSEQDLPLIMPKPITTREWNVRVRVPLDQAGMTHPHLTNLQHALRLARRTLARRGAANKQIFIITDGEPTAHLSGPPEAPILNLLYPPSQTTAEATLQEALLCAQAGHRIASFALIEDYFAMEWVGFVDQLTRLVRGQAFYCASADLGAAVFESYLDGRRTRKPLG